MSRADRDELEKAAIHPHAFRRTVATALGVESGQSQLGHTDNAVTRMHYIEPSTQFVDNSEALEAAFARREPQPPEAVVGSADADSLFHDIIASLDSTRTGDKSGLKLFGGVPLEVGRWIATQQRGAYDLWGWDLPTDPQDVMREFGATYQSVAELDRQARLIATEQQLLAIGGQDQLDLPDIFNLSERERGGGAFRDVLEEENLVGAAGIPEPFVGAILNAVGYVAVEQEVLSPTSRALRWRYDGPRHRDDLHDPEWVALRVDGLAETERRMAQLS